MIAMEQQFLSVKEVAKRLNVSEGIVKRWLRDEELPGYKFGGIWRVDPADLEQFLKDKYNQNQNKPT